MRDPHLGYPTKPTVISYRGFPTDNGLSYTDMKRTASTDSKNRLVSLAERPINNDIAFGIDVGIASCGWAVIDTRKEAVLAMGSRCFEPPEDPQKKTLYNAERRTKRGMRRVISRRSRRMNSVRQVIKQAGLVESPTHTGLQALGSDAPDPWETRALAMEESITSPRSRRSPHSYRQTSRLQIKQ